MPIPQRVNPEMMTIQQRESWDDDNSTESKSGVDDNSTDSTESSTTSYFRGFKGTYTKLYLYSKKAISETWNALICFKLEVSTIIFHEVIAKIV